MNPQILRRLLSLLTAVRLGDFRAQSAHGLRVGRCLGFSSALFEAGVITLEQQFLLDDLALNAGLHAGEPFPCAVNAGPVMPFGVQFDRRREAPKQPARVPASEPVTVSAPAPRPELRLFCLLVKGRDGAIRSLPVHTMRPMPPRVGPVGRWSLAGDPAFILRETRAERPAPEVLARYLRQRQTNALRADSRTF